MDEGDMEYLISELMMTTHTIALLESDMELVEMSLTQSNVAANLQLQYIIRQQVLDRLMEG